MTQDYSHLTWLTLRLNCWPCFSTDREAGLGAGALQPNCLLRVAALLSYLRSGCKQRTFFLWPLPRVVMWCTAADIVVKTVTRSHIVFESVLLLLHGHCELCFAPHTPQDCQVGLNFAVQQEAEVFQNAVEDKISQRNKVNNRQGQWGHTKPCLQCLFLTWNLYNDS